MNRETSESELKRERHESDMSPDIPEEPLPNGFIVCRQAIIRGHIQDAETVEEAEAVFISAIREALKEAGCYLDWSDQQEPTQQVWHNP